MAKGERYRALMDLNMASGKTYKAGKFIPATELLESSIPQLVAAGFIEIVKKES